MKLADFVGQQMTLASPSISGGTLLQIKLLGVEETGIWVESQTITNQVLEKFKVQSAPKTLVFFVPYAGIAYVIGSTEGPWILQREQMAGFRWPPVA